MTQEYKILWFEDSLEFVQSLLDPISEHVEAMGFKFFYECKPDDKELNEELLQKVDPDLIIVDYGLGSGTKGDTVVEKIRAIEPYADVIFYSGQKEDYINKISREIDGVFFTIRANLLEKTRKLINRSVRKQQEPNNMRGVIISEAVDIEGKMENLILTALGPDTERKNVIKKIIDPAWIFTFQNKFDLVNKIYKERIKSLNITKNSSKDPTKKAEIATLISQIEEKKQALVDAQKEVINIRNIMAHAIYDTATGCMISYVCTTPMQIDDAFCRKTRNDLRNHSENLDEISKLISTKIVA